MTEPPTAAAVAALIAACELQEALAAARLDRLRGELRELYTTRRLLAAQPFVPASETPAALVLHVPPWQPKGAQEEIILVKILRALNVHGTLNGLKVSELADVAWQTAKKYLTRGYYFESFVKSKVNLYALTEAGKDFLRKDAG